MRQVAMATAAALMLAGAARAETLIYLGEYKFNDPTLTVMGPGGAGAAELVGIVPAQDWLVVGVQVDPAAGRIYWTHGSFNDGRIRSADFDGSNQLTIASGLTNPRGLALDAAGGRVYWSDTQDNRIYRRAIAGGPIEPIATLNRQPGRPTLDLANGKVYFGTFDALGTGDIRRANLDGSNAETLFGGLYTPEAVALDLAAGKIYWVDSNTSFVSNHVARANLDGTEREILYDGLPISSGFTGIGLDIPAGKLYWCDEITDAEKGVWEADLDGSGATRIWESPAGWNAGAMTVVVTAACPCDLDGDGDVGVTDFLALLGSWGPNPGHPADLDGDGAVGVTDFLSLLARWGPCP
jgi:hypothetical protein